VFTLARPIPFLVRGADRAARTLVWLATAAEALVPDGYFAFEAPFSATPRPTRPGGPALAVRPGCGWAKRSRLR